MKWNDIQPGDIDGIELIGFRINPDSEQPDVYTFTTYGVKNILFASGDQIVFFTSKKAATRTFELFETNMQQQLVALLKESELVIYDVAKALHILNHKDVDESAIVLDFLNILFDLVSATQILMPPNYKEKLYGLADYLTFDQDFVTYLNQNSLDRKDVIDAILWCCGAVIVSSKVNPTINS